MDKPKRGRPSNAVLQQRAEEAKKKKKPVVLDEDGESEDEGLKTKGNTEEDKFNKELSKIEAVNAKAVDMARKGVELTIINKLWNTSVLPKLKKLRERFLPSGGIEVLSDSLYEEIENAVKSYETLKKLEQFKQNAKTKSHKVDLLLTKAEKQPTDLVEDLTSSEMRKQMREEYKAGSATYHAPVMDREEFRKNILSMSLYPNLENKEYLLKHMQ